jgi:hypothetical protein
MAISLKTIPFPNGNIARLARVPISADAQQVIIALELSAPRALLVLNGGTASLETDVREQLGPILAESARVVTEEEVTVITGGTNAGVFALFGEALQKWGGPTAPCIGVAVAGRAGLTRLEPHHTHFVSVEGDSWGEETPIMYRLAAALADNCPSLAVFASGGPTVITEMLQNVAQNREMILIAGSKGNTDAVVAACSGATNSDGRITRITREGRITTFEINQPPAELANLIRNQLLGTINPT